MDKIAGRVISPDQTAEYLEIVGALPEERGVAECCCWVIAGENNATVE